VRAFPHLCPRRLSDDSILLRSIGASPASPTPTAAHSGTLYALSRCNPSPRLAVRLSCAGVAFVGRAFFVFRSVVAGPTGAISSPVVRQSRPPPCRHLVPRRAWLLCVCLLANLSNSWVPLRTRAYSGLLNCLGFLFEPPSSRHQSPLSTMTDGAGPSSRPAPADRQHPRFRWPDFGPPARFVSEEEYNRGWRPCCEYCHRNQDVSPFFSI